MVLKPISKMHITLNSGVIRRDCNTHATKVRSVSNPRDALL